MNLIYICTTFLMIEDITHAIGGRLRAGLGYQEVCLQLTIHPPCLKTPSPRHMATHYSFR